MAAVYGSVGEYVEGEEEWALYLERLEQFFVANAVSEKGQRQAIFLSTIGPKTYKLLSTLVAPRKPAELKYELLTATLEKHFCPQPPLAVRRFKFHNANCVIALRLTGFVSRAQRLNRSKLIARERDLPGHRTRLLSCPAFQETQWLRVRARIVNCFGYGYGISSRDANMTAL